MRGAPALDQKETRHAVMPALQWEQHAAYFHEDHVVVRGAPAPDQKETRHVKCVFLQVNYVDGIPHAAIQWMVNHFVLMGFAANLNQHALQRVKPALSILDPKDEEIVAKSSCAPSMRNKMLPILTLLDARNVCRQVNPVISCPHAAIL